MIMPDLRALVIAAVVYTAACVTIGSGIGIAILIVKFCWQLI